MAQEETKVTDPIKEDIANKDIKKVADPKKAVNASDKKAGQTVAIKTV